MNCPSCGAENRAGRKFCVECGSRLALHCLACGTPYAAGEKFCGECGATLQALGAGDRASVRSSPDPRPLTPDPRSYTPKHLADKILQSRSALEGERKQVTVLFADVKGSMELAEQLDPEEWHTILDRFFAILNDGVHRFEGTVNQYTGDGIMALFGAPIAHEDHAQRACLAVLHLREALRAYADELRRTHAVSFAARMGLNSGEVVVGKICDDLRMDYTAQGHTVGLALRGDSEGGLRLIEESLTQVARPGREERYCLAEILRLKGWMRARQGDLDGAEQNYRASLDWARQQQGKSWELRTATSLARLWQQQGKRTEAHQMLSESQRTPREAGGLLGWAVSKTAMIG